MVEFKLDPLGTSATEWPIVPVPGGEFGGMKIGKGNRITRRKSAPAPLCPPQIPLARLELEPGPPRWEATTNRLSYGVAQNIELLNDGTIDEKIRLRNIKELWES
jgi:hypothetical protein